MLDKEEVQKIARLSKLEFTEEEFLNITKTLNEIFDYMKEIDSVDVEGVKPLYNVLDIVDRTREDEVLNTVKREDFLQNAPQKDDEYIILPKIV